MRRFLDGLYLLCGAAAALSLIAIGLLMLTSVITRPLGLYVPGLNAYAGYAMAASSFVALTIFYIILGCFLDGISAVVLTMAVIEPMVKAAGFDMIWFGIFLVIVVELAQITPSVGFNLFVLQGLTNHDMGYIARASLPLFCMMVVAVVLIVAFPEIATWLPETLRGRS